MSNLRRILIFLEDEYEHSQANVDVQESQQNSIPEGVHPVEEINDDLTNDQIQPISLEIDEDRKNKFNKN